jgi:hypothetical protein
MAEKFVMQCKKSAQTGTTVTLVPDDNVGEGHPLDLAFTQAVLTFAATPTRMYGAAAADGRKYRVTVEEYT